MSQIFKDEDRLFPAYIPDKLPHRELQLSKLRDIFHPTLRRSIPRHAFIRGASGVGKTVLGKKMARQLGREGSNLKAVYLNCKETPTNDLLMLALIRKLKMKFPESGYPAEKKYHQLSAWLKERNIHLLLVLDEVDALIAREKTANLIYLFTRARELGRGDISLMLISVQDVRALMDMQSSSMFGARNTIALDKYDGRELRDILEQRAELAFRPGIVLDEAIALIAKLVAEDGNARIALDTLWYAGGYAESQRYEQVTSECVRAAMAEVAPTTDERKLQTLDAKTRLLLLAICDGLRKHDEPHVSMGKVIELYDLLCEGYELEELKRSATTIWRMAKKLEDEGIILTEVKHSRDGTTTLFYLRDMPANELRETLLKML